MELNDGLREVTAYCDRCQEFVKQRVFPNFIHCTVCRHVNRKERVDGTAPVGPNLRPDRGNPQGTD